jgi:two-component sensor histidine kinase
MLDHPAAHTVAPQTQKTGLQESNHRIANNLALVSSLMRMKANAIAKTNDTLTADEAAGLLREVAMRVESVARLHRLLSGEGVGADIPAGAHLSEICTGISSSLAYDHQVVFDDESGTLKLPPERLNALSLFLAEGLTNSIKHAHPAGAPGKITVRLHGDHDAIHLAIQDDGVGLPVGFDSQRHGGLGMRIMRSLSAQLGGSMSMKATDLGVRVALRLPAMYAAAAPSQV